MSVEHYARLTANEPDRDGTGARAERAAHQLGALEARLALRGHDTTAQRYAVPLLATLGDLTTPTSRRALAASLRSLLPATAVRDVADLDAAREWLTTLRGVIPRPRLFERYLAAGAPGNLPDKGALFRLAAEVLGEPRRRASGYVYVVAWGEPQ